MQNHSSILLNTKCWWKNINFKIESLSQRIDEIEQITLSSLNHGGNIYSKDNVRKGKDLIREHFKSDTFFQLCTKIHMNNLLKAFKSKCFKANSVIFTEYDEAN